MQWNMAAEWVAGLVTLVILIYALRSARLSSLSDRLFLLGAGTALLAILLNLLSAYWLGQFRVLPAFLPMTVTTLYFIVTPFMPVVYFFYVLSTVHAKEPLLHWKLWVALCTVPYCLYVLLILVNWSNGIVFSIDPVQGYVQGSHKYAMYLVFYFYCFTIFVVTFLRRKAVEPRVMSVLLTFPLIALSMVFVQLFSKEVVMTGSASAITLLVLFLFLQNRRIAEDSLTGLRNRVALMQALDAAILQGYPFSLLAVSLRDFKTINDRFGAASGDVLLAQVAVYLQTVLSAQSTYRFSGDEFILLFSGDNRVALDDTYRRIEARFDLPWRMNDMEYLLNCSFARVDYPDAGADTGTLTGSLELAIRASKQNGGGLCTFDSTAMSAHRRRQLVADVLKTSLQTDKFQLFYQPIWSLTEQRFTQAESLLRLPDTPIGPLFPDEFIPVAEETGLIVALTYRVLAMAASFIRQLDDEGLSIDCLSVNFAFVQFLQPDMENNVLRILAEQGVTPNRIKIEITERTIIENPEIVSRAMRRLSQQGIRFAVDDFGTGYSNIETILRLPFSIIKLDKSILQASMKTESLSVFFKHLVSGMKALDKRIVAEGIETKAQRDFVADGGCDAIQGYYFARPMSAKQTLSFLREARQAGIERNCHESQEAI